LTTKSIEASEAFRDVLKSVLRSSKGIGNDEVVSLLRDRHGALLRAAAEYLERTAIVKLIGDVSDKRRAIVVADQNQGELFDLPHPQIITITVIEDGKPKKVRKDFLDATLEEAERVLAPTPLKVPNVDKDARARAFVDRLRPLMAPGMTFRQAIEKTRR
jgi:hypothetical protein